MPHAAGPAKSALPKTLSGKSSIIRTSTTRSDLRIPNDLLRRKNHPQPPHNQHFQIRFGSAQNKRLTTPLKSALPQTAPLTPAESALPKIPGEDVARSLLFSCSPLVYPEPRRVTRHSPLPRGTRCGTRTTPLHHSTFNFRLSTCTIPALPETHQLGGSDRSPRGTNEL